LTDHGAFRPRPRRDSADLVDVLTDRWAGRELAELPEPRVTARAIAVELMTALRAGDTDLMFHLLEKVHLLAARIEEPESAADRKAIRREESEDWATTRVHRSRPKAQ
jgi:hypothetical protein